jgi:ubiquitin-protein ligase
MATGSETDGLFQIVLDYDELELSAGLYVLPDSVDLFVWHLCFFVRSGPYCGGVFRAVLTINRRYPGAGARPALTFIDKPFSPLVNPNVRPSLLDTHITPAAPRLHLSIPTLLICRQETCCWRHVFSCGKRR